MVIRVLFDTKDAAGLQESVGNVDNSWYDTTNDDFCSWLEILHFTFSNHHTTCLQYESYFV
ncbi:hypothetical protein HAX54_031185, partial [Datura stramonium]|nr:hypothetical protein [Datura stramonium]